MRPSLVPNHYRPRMQDWALQSLLRELGLGAPNLLNIRAIGDRPAKVLLNYETNKRDAVAAALVKKAFSERDLNAISPDRAGLLDEYYQNVKTTPWVRPTNLLAAQKVNEIIRQYVHQIAPDIPMRQGKTLTRWRERDDKCVITTFLEHPSGELFYSHSVDCSGESVAKHLSLLEAWGMAWRTGWSYFETEYEVLRALDVVKEFVRLFREGQPWRLS